MLVHPIVLDSRPAWLGRTGAASLLAAPFGASRVLDCLRAALDGLPAEPPRILSGGLRRPVPPGAALGDLLELDESCKPTDLLLLIDARFLPLPGRRFAELVDFRLDAPLAQHLLLLERNPRSATELVQQDDSGRVRRIRRYYEGVTYVRARATVAALLPAAMTQLMSAPAPGGLDDLRAGLGAAGLPAQDLPVSSGMIDTIDAANFLEVSHLEIRRAVARREHPGYRRVGRDALVADTAELAGGVRLHGPVIIQPGARVAGRTTIVGPALIGPAAQIATGARIVQAVVLPGVRVSTGATVIQSVADRDPADGADAVPPASLAFRRARARLAMLPEPRPSSVAARATYPAVKAVAEGVLAAVGLLALSPLLLLTALLVKLESRGPAFFGHIREGRDGRPFRCWKFRTMVDGADRLQRALRAGARNQVDGPQFKLARDPRITLVGRFLRSTNIDELPQLFNVLRGQMSLIGPRPSPFVENQICMPWRKVRLSVRPGITGLWQVCRADRASSDFHQWIYYDMLYVRHQSAWLDGKILLMTLATLGGRTAAPLHWLIPRHRLHADMQHAPDNPDEGGTTATVVA